MILFLSAAVRIFFAEKPQFGNLISAGAESVAYREAGKPDYIVSDRENREKTPCFKR